MTVRLRMGVPTLDAGYTLVPNLLLDHYEALSLTDSTALFVMRLLCRCTGGREVLPDSPQTREYLQALQSQGLLSVRRWPDRVELHLDALFHNLARLAEWLADGNSPDDFQVETPADMPAGGESAMERFDSAEFKAEVDDVLAAFVAANQRLASPAEKAQIRNLAVRFDGIARAAAEASNGPAWVMAALRSVLERDPLDGISVSDLEEALEQRTAASGGMTEPTGRVTRDVRQETVARARQMSNEEREALETVVMAYRGISGEPPDDQLILTLMRLSDAYGPTWVLNAIHETGKVQQIISPEYVESILVRWQSEGRIPGIPAAAESPPITDPLLTRVVALYEQEIGPLTPQVRDQLLALTDAFRDEGAWQRAFAEAAKTNARNLRYVEAVLRGKGKKPSRSARRPSRSGRRRGAGREGEWTEEELDAERRRSLSETPIDVESFLGEGT
jgi:hypothetical protein